MSNTEKTKINKAPIDKKQIQYSFSYFETEFQLANIQIGIKNVLNIMKKIEMPSTPKNKCKFKDGNHSVYSKNWNFGVELSNNTKRNNE